MKNLIFFSLFLFVLAGCTNNLSKPDNSILFEDPKPSEKNYIFSTTGGKMIILLDSKNAQLMSDETSKNNNFSLRNIGIGNAFVVNDNGGLRLCTAKHCAVGIERITKPIGADIAIIDFKDLVSFNFSNDFNIELTKGYEIDTIVSDFDSVFVRGYFFDKNNKIKSVTILGLGIKKDASSFKGKDINLFGEEYLQEKTISVELEENVDLSGLSGAPAFNKFGKVVGVYTGRTIYQVPGGKDKYFARISLLK